MDVNWKDMMGRNGLLIACGQGYTDIVNLLLARDEMDVNWKDKDGRNCFHHACDKGHTEIVNLLLAIDDVDVTLKDESGKTGFRLVYEKHCHTSLFKLGEIGALICTQRNMQPSELLNTATMKLHPEIIEEIQRSIRSRQQKSACK